MKKMLCLLAVAALAFTGCNNDGDPYEQLRPVAPGINIYVGAWNQNSLATAPVQAGVRIAMLVAEAEKQGLEINEVTHNNVSVAARLFGDATKVQKLESGDYEITYNEKVQVPGGYFFSGKLTISTNGAELPIQTDEQTRWSISFSDGFKAVVYTDYGPSSILLTRGLFSLYNNGDGSYTASVSNVALNLESQKRYSDWSGDFVFTPADESLAYSLCTGKEIKANGKASGPSYYTYDNSSATKLSYELENGVFKGGTQILGGREICKLIGNGDFDPSVFPARDVIYEWAYANGSLSQTIRYNGAIYVMNY